MSSLSQLYLRPRDSCCLCPLWKLQAIIPLISIHMTWWQAKVWNQTSHSSALGRFSTLYTTCAVIFICAGHGPHQVLLQVQLWPRQIRRASKAWWYRVQLLPLSASGCGSITPSLCRSPPELWSLWLSMCHHDVWPVWHHACITKMSWDIMDSNAIWDEAASCAVCTKVPYPIKVSCTCPLSKWICRYANESPWATFGHNWEFDTVACNKRMLPKSMSCQDCQGMSVHALVHAIWWYVALIT